MIDQALLEQIQYATLESPDGGQTWPSGTWSRDEVLGYLTQRQNRLQKETLLLAAVDVIGAGPSRFVLPADWMRTLEATWYGSDGTIQILHRSDAFATDCALPTWETTADTPLVYHEYNLPTLTMEIAPTPGVAGQIVLLYISTAPPVTGNGVPLFFPDEFAWALKYGVLADMLGKDGRGKDPARAQYAEDRFQLAIELGRIILQGWA